MYCWYRTIHGRPEKVERRRKGNETKSKRRAIDYWFQPIWQKTVNEVSHRVSFRLPFDGFSPGGHNRWRFQPAMEHKGRHKGTQASCLLAKLLQRRRIWWLPQSMYKVTSRRSWSCFFSCTSFSGISLKTINVYRLVQELVEYTTDLQTCLCSQDF